MKSLANRSTNIKVQTDDGIIEGKYSDIIRLALKQPKQGGFDYEDIGNRIKIDSALKGEHIELEDAPYKYLVNLIKNATWSFWHEDLIKLKDDIISCQ